jgi:hypothetical protein
MNLKFLILLYIVFLILTYNNRSHSALSDSKTRTVVLLTDIRSADDKSKESELESALKSHLGTISVALKTIKINLLPALQKFNVQVLADIQKKFNALAIIWIVDTDVIFWAPFLNNTPEVINVNNLKSGSLKWAETASMLIYSNVYSLVPQYYDENNNPQNDDVNIQKAVIVKIYPHKRLKIVKKSINWWIGISAAYSPYFIIDTKNIFHRAKAETQVGIGRYIIVGIGVEGGPSVKFNLENSSAANLYITTIRTYVSMEISHKKFYIQPGLGALISMVNISGINYNLKDNNSKKNQTNPGLQAAITVGYTPFKHSSIFLAGGLDIYRDSITYTVKDETLAHLKRVAPVINAGISFRFNLSNRRY